MNFATQPSSPAPSPAPAAQAAVGTPGAVFLVGAGPGDPSLVTVRGAELLSNADVVIHDPEVHPALLEQTREGARVQPVDASPGQVDALVTLARQGLQVVWLTAGDPFLESGLAENVAALAEAGVRFEVVPGIPSAVGAATYAGIPLAHGALAAEVTLTSMPRKEGALGAQPGTLTACVDADQVPRLCARWLQEVGRDPTTPAAVIQRGTRAEQRVVEGRLDTIAGLAASLDGPVVLVAGQVARLRCSLRWFDTRPLFGKRVLVTRPAGQAAVTSARLRRCGAEPIEWPTIQITPPPDPVQVTQTARTLDRYDVVAFTSENGVDWFFRTLDHERLDARAFGRARVAAIGPGTAAALLPRGIRADIVPIEFRGEALAAAILADSEVVERLSQGHVRVLIPRARVAREVLGERLRDAGCEVDVVPVYETLPASLDRRQELVQRLDAHSIDVLMLTSSSTADSVCEHLGTRAASLLRGVLVASIGPITTATAENRGLTVGLTATESTLEGLITALEHHFATR